MASPRLVSRLSGRETVRLSSVRRFFSKFTVDSSSGCWEWLGGVSSSGYPIFGDEGLTTSAHRMSYLWFVGPLAEEQQIDHVCLNKRCVNPSHLESVTRSENVRRASAVKGLFCKHGHPQTPENTRMWKGQHGKTRRYCLLCRQLHRTRKAA